MSVEWPCDGDEQSNQEVHHEIPLEQQQGAPPCFVCKEGQIRQTSPIEEEESPPTSMEAKGISSSTLERRPLGALVINSLVARISRSGLDA